MANVPTAINRARRRRLVSQENKDSPRLVRTSSAYVIRFASAPEQRRFASLLAPGATFGETVRSEPGLPWVQFEGVSLIGAAWEGTVAAPGPADSSRERNIPIVLLCRSSDVDCRAMLGSRRRCVVPPERREPSGPAQPVSGTGARQGDSQEVFVHNGAGQRVCPATTQAREQAPPDGRATARP
jgi:hypothetical protein